MPVLSSAHEPVAAGEAAAVYMRGSCASRTAASGLVKEGIAYGHHGLFGHGFAGSKMVRRWCLTLSSWFLCSPKLAD